MPGKYLEFIKSGRYVVPVELTFLPVTYTDVVTARTLTSSKWVDKNHWKEMKTMLRPAVESVSKAHETGSGKVTTSHHVAHGIDVSFGYVIEVSKDKCNFLAVLDPQLHCWTDDEEEQENVDLDLGGRHQNLTTTDWYVKAVVIKRSFSTVEDAKKIRKELGIKPDDVRNFLSTSNSEKKGTEEEEKDKDSSNSKAESSDDDDEYGRSTTETESLMEIPPPSGIKILQPTCPPNHQVNSMGFVSLRPSCFRGNTPRETDSIDEFSLRRLYRQRSPPGEYNAFWNNGESDEEELPDIEEFSSAVAYPKEKKTASKPRSPRKRGGSPYKHRCVDTGLPDIDEGRKVAAGRGNGGKRRRTVAIVEPMKPVNSDDMPTESRKRRGRNLNFSPTFGFGGRGNSRNSAIEILQEDSELLPIPDYTPVFALRRPDPPPPRRKRKKRAPRSETARLFDEERRNRNRGGSDGSSEPEMPFLERMVSTSDEEQQLRARGEERRPVDPLALLEEVIRISEETTQVVSDVENNASSESEQEVTMPSPAKHKKRVKKRSKVVEDERNVRELSPDMSTLGVKLVRRYAASDSDDITAESAYRKKPVKKRRKKRRVQNVQNPPEKSPEPQPPLRSTGDAQTQTVSSLLPPQEEEEEQPEVAEKSNEAEETMIVAKRECTEYDSNFAEVAAFSDSDNDDVVFQGEVQSNLYLPALGSPEEGLDSLDLFSFETIVPNPLYSYREEEPPLIKLSPDSSRDDEDNDSIPLVPLLLDDDHNEVDFESNLSSCEDYQEGLGESTSMMDYTFDVSENLSSLVREKPIPDPILRRALRLNLSDDSDEHTEEPEEEVVGEEPSIPKNMSTFDIISNPHTLKASLGLLDQLKSSQPTQAEKDKELMPPPLMRRPSSPDICSLNPEGRMKRPKLKKQGPPKPRPDSPQPGPSKQVYQVQDPLLGEFLSRVDQVGSEDDYEPAGDQFDLSQRSHCMRKVIPQYATKSRMCKIHKKNIQDLTFSRIKEEFEAIKPQIRGIFEGTYHSERNLLFCRNTQNSLKTLEKMKLMFSPFENSQVGWLSSLINEYLVPQAGSRIKYVEYMKYVMLPETCIRIYSRVNGINLELAETEMKFGAYYDQPLDTLDS